MGRRSNYGKRKNKKHKKGEHNQYYQREALLNSKIKEFYNKFYSLHKPPQANEYHEMNRLRMEIKRLFNIQGRDVWNKSFNRKHVYIDQLNKFKPLYMRWKRLTVFVFLEELLHIPSHIVAWIKDIEVNKVSTRVFGT